MDGGVFWMFKGLRPTIYHTQDRGGVGFQIQDLWACMDLEEVLPRSQ